MKSAALILSSILLVSVASHNASAQTEPKAADKSAEKTTEKSTETTKSEKKVKKETKHDGKSEVNSANGSATKKDGKKDSAKDDALPKEVKKLIMHDSTVGTGKIATKGKKIKVNYTGWLYDPTKTMGRGQQFDTSVGREPFTFTLGAGEVIKGWDDGFENMKVGGKRKLIIPAELGYGSRGAGNDIPPNRDLMFEVELLDVM